jgi:hypothetical protein
MLATLPFVAVGIARMRWLTRARAQTAEDPTLLSWTDPCLAVSLASWALTAAVVSATAAP